MTMVLEKKRRRLDSRRTGLVEDIRSRIMARRQMQRTPAVRRSMERLEKWLYRLSDEGRESISRSQAMANWIKEPWYCFATMNNAGVIDAWHGGETLRQFYHDRQPFYIARPNQ